MYNRKWTVEKGLKKMRNKLEYIKRKDTAKRNVIKKLEDNTDLVELCWVEGN